MTAYAGKLFFGLADEPGPILFDGPRQVDDTSTSQYSTTTYTLNNGDAYTPDSPLGDTLRWEFSQSASEEAFGISHLAIDVLIRPEGTLYDSGAACLVDADCFSGMCVADVCAACAAGTPCDVPWVGCHRSCATCFGPGALDCSTCLPGFSQGSSGVCEPTACTIEHSTDDCGSQARCVAGSEVFPSEDARYYRIDDFEL